MIAGLLEVGWASGFKFVGPTIVYAYMQSMGLVDDHLTTCWRKPA